MSDSSIYTPPAIWQWNKENGGQFASINRPIAGLRTIKSCLWAATRCSCIRWARPMA